MIIFLITDLRNIYGDKLTTDDLILGQERVVKNKSHRNR